MRFVDWILEDLPLWGMFAVVLYVIVAGMLQSVGMLIALPLLIALLVIVYMVFVAIFDK